MMRDAGIQPINSDIESHISLGAGEWYHSMLRQIFRTVCMDHASIHLDISLSLAVWAMNHTAGPAGISPQLLVLGVNLRMPVKPTYPVTASTAKPSLRRATI